jgi:group II intron reverse transcriptase/maturase
MKHQNNFHVNCSKPILFLPKLCEETKLWQTREQAKKLFSSLQKKIATANPEVKELITEDGIATVINKFYVDVTVCSENGQKPFNLFEILCDPNFLLIVYVELKTRGLKSPGSDDVPTHNVTPGGIVKLSKELKAQKYKPNPVRRVYIPKSDGSKRPLGIASTRDKIVQLGLKKLLTPIYEKKFLKTSFGFRPGKNCHSALETIDISWRNTTWFIEADVVKAFDRIHHNILRKILKRDIREPTILDLIGKQLKAGYVDFSDLGNSQIVNTIGTPQGSVISPLLCNIYLHPFDVFMDDVLLKVWNTPRTDQVSVEYKKGLRSTGNDWEPIHDQIKKIAPGVTSKVIRKQLAEVKKLDIVAREVPYYETDPNHHKLKYVRYADDFLIGYVGPKINAWIVLQQAAYFLESELKLQMHPTKSGVKHHEKGTLFLGYHLHGNYRLKPQYNKELGQRTRSNWIKFGIPVRKIFKRFAEKGFFQIAKKGKQTRYVARRVDKWLFLPSDEAVVHKFNSVARGLAEYYSGSRTPSQLIEFWANIKRSLALTLSHRHNKKTAKYAFKKWGNDLKVSEKVWWKKPEMKNTGKWKGTGLLTNIIDHKLVGSPFPKTLASITSASQLDCAIPNCPNSAEEWHHIKHRKRNKKASLQIAAKQIPICKKHHVLIHNGNYDGPSLKKIAGYTIDSLLDYLKDQ